MSKKEMMKDLRFNYYLTVDYAGHCPELEQEKDVRKIFAEGAYWQFRKYQDWLKATEACIHEMSHRNSGLALEVRRLKEENEKLRNAVVNKAVAEEAEIGERSNEEK